MKQLLASLLVLILTGCASSAVPVSVKFPAVPADLLKSCPDLKLVDQKTDKLSVVLDVVTDNYITYYECRSKIDDWTEWYNSQKAIFDKLR
jgi:hypothetical protein